MFDRFHQKAQEEVELNLTPIMNLFVAMIPFLLMCASFYTVSVVNASVPVQSEGGESDVAAGEEKVTLTVQVRGNGTFKVTAQSDSLAEPVLDAMTKEIPARDGSLDFDAMEAYAASIKARYPKSDTAMLLPQKDIEYDGLIQAMDALREKVDKVGKEDVYTVLFPVIVVSTLSTKPAAGTEGGGAK